MRKLFSLLLLPFSLLGSDSCGGAAQLLWDTEPSTFIHGCVNAQSGAFCLQETDIQSFGKDPLPLQRFYHSKNRELWELGVGGRSNYPSQGGFVDRHEDHYHLELEDFGGATTQYTGRPSGDVIEFSMEPKLLRNGYTNNGGAISGRTNKKNTRVLFRSPKKTFENSKGSCVVTKGSGQKEIYSPVQRGRFWLYHKEEVKRPSGNRELYSYADSWGLRRIETQNAGKKTLHWLEFEGDANRGQPVCIRASNGRSAKYRFHEDIFRESGAPYLIQATPSHAPETFFSYEHVQAYDYRMNKVSHPDGRYLGVNYYKKTGWVHELLAPSGPEGKVEVLYQFGYSFSKKHKRMKNTIVDDACGLRRWFHYDAHCRLHRIDHRPEGGSVYRSYFFYWGKEEEPNEGNLLARAVKDDQGRTLSSLSLDYDERGNVIAESLYGNFTGKGPEFYEVDDEGKPQGDVECQRTVYTYSEDGFNLKLSETKEGGPTIRYEYVPGTDLLAAKKVYEGQRIVGRTFYSYDENATLIEEVEDDGEGEKKEDLHSVQQRLITRIRPVSQPKRPGFGLPGEIWKGYWDSERKEEVLLCREVRSYESGDLLSQIKTYDGDGRLWATQKWVYDEKGRCIEEIDPEGICTHYTYDDNFNCTSSYREGSGWTSYFEYDLCNRLICEREVHDEGTTKEKYYEYDALGRKTAEVDSLGHRTESRYDAYGRCIEITQPELASGIRPKEVKEYDLCDNVTAFVDPEGNRTETRYNSCGKPIHIVHPDGGEERFIYSLQGLLLRHECQDGTAQEFTYDKLQRLIRKEYFDSEGQIIWEESHKYQGALLSQSVNAKGVRQVFTYDGAGRVLSEVQLHPDYPQILKRVEMTYNARGEVASQKVWSKEEAFLETRTQRDLMGREIEISTFDEKETLQSQVRYEYDSMGRKTHIHEWQKEDLWATTETEFNSQGQVTCVTDAMGERWPSLTEEGVLNGQGQRVLRITREDPLGRKTVEEYTPLGQMAFREIYGSNGQLLKREEWSYNAKGQPLTLHSDVLSEGDLLRIHTVEWTYDSMGRVERVKEEGEREWKTVYDSMGRVLRIIQPNGVELLHHYDAKGVLVKQESSDGSVVYLYQVDPWGRILESKNLLTGETVTRSYDPLDHIQKEVMEGYALEFDWDALGRCTKCTLPDGSRVYRNYKGAHLLSVERMGAKGGFLYAQRYQAFDGKGRLLSAQRPGGKEELSRTYDQLGRVVQWTVGGYTEHREYDSVGNLLERRFVDALGVKEESFSYDELNQLIQEQEHDYCYDSLQNRLRKDGVEYQVDSLNCVLGDGEWNYEYDGNGNLIEKVSKIAHWIYRYDAWNRLILAEKKEEVRMTYTYDSWHRRLSESKQKWEGNAWGEGEIRRFLYEGLCEVGVMDAQGNLLEFRTLADGQKAETGAAIAVELKGKPYIPVHDAQGNVVALEMFSGSIVETYRYGAFGEEEVFDAEGEVVEESPAGNAWRFASKRVEGDLGWVFFGRRFYDPRLGRWSGPDPAGYGEGANLYAFVQNRPFSQWDAFGLRSLADTEKHFHYSEIDDWDGPCGRQFYNEVARGIGWCLETAAFHLLPTSQPARFSFETAGRFLKCEDPDFFKNVEERVRTGAQGRGELQSADVMAVTGIFSTRKDAENLAGELSHRLEGSRVEYFCRETRGLVQDVTEAILSQEGTRTKGVMRLRRRIEDLYHEKALNDPDWRLYIVAHSRGVADVHAATYDMHEKIRGRISVLGLGGAVLLDPKDYSWVNNAYDRHDIVQLVTRKIGGGDFDYVDCHYEGRLPYNIQDHYWRSSAYQETLDEQMGNIFKKHR